MLIGELAWLSQPDYECERGTLRLFWFAIWGLAWLFQGRLLPLLLAPLLSAPRSLGLLSPRINIHNAFLHPQLLLPPPKPRLSFTKTYIAIIVLTLTSCATKAACQSARAFWLQCSSRLRPSGISPDRSFDSLSLYHQTLTTRSRDSFVIASRRWILDNSSHMW